MAPITFVHSESSTLSPARTAGSALRPLLSVLDVIRRVNNGGVGLRKDNGALRDFLISMRTAAFCIWSILSERATELDSEWSTRYCTVILDAVEDAVEVDGCNRVLELNCGPRKACAYYFQKAHQKTHPKSHALCHSATFSFPDSPARDHLRQTLPDAFDELQIKFTDDNEPLIQSASKRRRDPPWEISTSAGQAFHAISQCRHGLEACGIREHLEAHLALATYLDISEEDEHFMDLLFALDTDKQRCDEVRIHAQNPAHTATASDTRAGRPKVKFADARRKRQIKRLKKVSNFCELLGAPNVHKNAVFRVNVTVDADSAMWLHPQTHRELKQAGLSNSISLAAILASDTRGLSDMAKLVLAVILSYSLFYLFGGPWLGPRQAAEWSRENIVFFKKGSNIPLRPFLRSDLRGNNSHAVNEEEGLMHQYPALLCFGITLLEIHLGDTLESFLNLPEPLTDLDDKYARACEVFEQRKPFIRGQYREVVKACLDTQFGEDDDGADWSENEDEDEDESDPWEAADEGNMERLRGIIFNEIVRPLHDDLEKSFGTLMQFDDLDKQAASMDFRSGLSVAEVEVHSPIRNHNYDEKSPKEGSFTHPDTSRPQTGKTKTDIAFATKEPDSPIFPRVSFRHTSNGILHSVSGGPNPQSSDRLDEHSPTDNWFSQFGKLETLYPLRQVQPGDARRVRVAVIDTGIDMGHVDMQAAAANGQIAKVCDWVDGRQGVEDETVGDCSGHGTHIASVLLGMAPHVDLYVARVSKQRELFEGEAENVAKAIRTAAFTWKCDIISLSLGFTRGVPCIQTELESAIDAGALVFAAASNDGANSRLAYPAWHSRVLCIYSSDGYGNKSPFNPPPEKHSSADGFSIIGQHIRGAWPSNLSPEGANNHVCRLSGTSCATPVAAALAAVILGFASSACEPEKLKTKSFLKLASYDGMRRVLWEMTTLRDGYQYLTPFWFFSRTRDEIETDIWKALNPEK